MGESVGAGFDDAAAEGETINDLAVEARVGERLRPTLEDSFDAIATEFFSSRSVRTWKRNSAYPLPVGLKTARQFVTMVSDL